MPETNARQNDVALNAQIVSVRGRADAAMVLTLAGVGWIMIGLSALGQVPLWVLPTALVVPACLLCGTIALQKQMRSLPLASQLLEVEKVLRQATIVECIAIAITVLVAGLFHRPEFIMPLVALAVGLHFFPLARAFQRPLYYGTGSALCMVAIGVPLLVPPQFQSGARHISGWLLASGVSGATILWLTTLALLMQCRTLLQNLVLPTK